MIITSGIVPIVKIYQTDKKIAITRLPQVLIINFKRFKMTASGGFHKLETL